MRIIVNSDEAFLITDEAGDVPGSSEYGLYCADTRCLSRYHFTLDGQVPVTLAARAQATDTALHFLTNGSLAGVARGQLGIVRTHIVDAGLRETIEITNYGITEAVFTVELRVEVDFLHLFDAKHEAQVNSQNALASGIHDYVALEDGRGFLFSFAGSSRSRAVAFELSATSRVDGDDSYAFNVRLEPQERWRLTAQFYMTTSSLVATSTPRRIAAGEARDTRLARYRERLIAQAPTLETDSLPLKRAYEQSIRDFAALQIALDGHAADDAADVASEFVIAAGIPWFMTLFGRDSLITAYQALAFFPEAARGTLRTLARLQGQREDPLSGEQPGKILHEYRSPTFVGKRNSAAVFPYYGTIDATPLFLVTLGALCDVTGEYAIARELREPALRALRWMERYGDRDGDGFIEYIREGEAGLWNQGWKDSDDAVRFRDGGPARPPTALSEVQGYAYAARMGLARIFDHLDEGARADTLRRQAEELRERFEQAFWMPERDYYAFALDGEKRQVNALASNPGQALWSGIISPERARSVARRLVAPELFSGWGVRTLATTEGGYNPVSYHNGSVWPHDNSLIVSGLARYGLLDEAKRIAQGMLQALEFASEFRLPELFAGYGRDDAPFPIEYPTACYPQAWATGSIFLLLATMTGLDPSAYAGLGAPFLPDDIQRVALHGVWRAGRRINVEALRVNGEIVARAWE